MNDDPVRPFRQCGDEFRWDGVELRDYKAAGTAQHRDITRQTLFSRADMRGELRYFEVAMAGHSTLERHVHAHAVMILRGMGRVLVGARVISIRAFDLVTIPPRTWHQFRAARDAPLGFLCMVDAERDRPELPAAADLARLESHPEVAAFLADAQTPR
jgi:quercetin dioxygenase-like cupin family protein